MRCNDFEDGRRETALLILWTHQRRVTEVLREQGSRRIVHLGRVLLNIGIFPQLLNASFTCGGRAVL